MSAIHPPTSAASRQLRRHTGTSTSGALAHLVHALQGLLCRAKGLCAVVELQTGPWQIVIEGITLYRFRDGKLAEMWDRYDNLAVVQQLGLAPEAVPPSPTT